MPFDFSTKKAYQIGKIIFCLKKYCYFIVLFQIVINFLTTGHFKMKSTQHHSLKQNAIKFVYKLLSYFIGIPVARRH